MMLQPKTTTPGKVLLFGLGMLLFPSWSLASTETDLQNSRLKLNQTLKRLHSETKKLRAQQGEEKGLLGDLENLDQQLSILSNQRVARSRQMQDAMDQLPELKQQVQWQQERLETIRTNLASHVRLMYGLGGQGILKVILSQENTARARQGVLYYGLVIRDRNAQLHLFSETLEKWEKSVENHQRLLAETQKLADQLAAEFVLLEQKRKERVQLLTRVLDQKNLQQQKVKELETARDALSAFVDKLQSALVDLPDTAPKERIASQPTQQPAQNLAQSAPLPNNTVTQQKAERIVQKKGRLKPPVTGSQGQSRPPGLFYKVESDTDVKAIFRGQVVYADWFRGYGLLVILNHGDHIFSLYGHNKKLLVAPGDWVENQEKLSESGDTGSLEGVTGLYFEIRDNGLSVNPRLWLGS
ncbi:MAG: peptidoglycan DD-metalloendopeptidase family protein [Magnetococcales bacterium]|nr:peptidoglycan DD-metalloendopeptidase family protein [Magnetococcales bacterium]